VPGWVPFPDADLNASTPPDRNALDKNTGLPQVLPNQGDSGAGGGGGGGGGPSGPGSSNSPSPTSPPTNEKPPVTPPVTPPTGGDGPPTAGVPGFDFPAGAAFPLEFVGEWEVYSIAGDGTAKYLIMSFSPGGNFGLAKTVVSEAEIPADAPTASGFDTGGESAWQPTVPDYWWIIGYAEGAGTLFIYYDAYFTESYGIQQSGDSILLNGVQFRKIQA